MRWPHSRFVTIVGIALINLGGLAYYYLHLVEYGFLPSPFVFDKANTFMDLFNPMYWAYDDGRYTEWKSVYPPLNFLLLRLANFVAGNGWPADPFSLRASSPAIALGYVMMSLLCLAAMFALEPWRTFRKSEKLALYLAMVASTPMLFALERGNLVVLCPILVALALCRSGALRSLPIALLINIKPYFAVLLIYYLAKNDWKGFVQCLFFSGLIFVVSGVMLDAQFLYFLFNLFSFSQQTALFPFYDVLAMPSSISAISNVLFLSTGKSMETPLHLDKPTMHFIAWGIEAIKLAVVGTSVAALFRQARSMRDAEVLAVLVVALTNFSVSVGGYTLVLYMAMIPCLAGMRYGKTYLALLACIAMPMDWLSFATMLLATNQHAYLSDWDVVFKWRLGLGSLMRPGMNLFLLGLLSYEILTRARTPHESVAA